MSQLAASPCLSIVSGGTAQGASVRVLKLGTDPESAATTEIGPGDRSLLPANVHSGPFCNAARLLPKPMPPNVAKRARMNICRQKPAITWTDLSCRGRFGICAKFQNPDGCALRGPSGHDRKAWGRSKLRH